MERQKPSPELLFPLPLATPQNGDDTDPNETAHDKPATPALYRKVYHTICEKLLYHRHVSFHHNSQDILTLNGILEDVIAHLARIESSEQSILATEQQRVSQVMNRFRHDVGGTMEI